MKRLLAVFTAITLFAAAGAKNVMGQQSAAEFYKGERITFIVPYLPGGGYDAYARLMAPYLKQYTGSTVIVKNKPGGGGAVGANIIYRANPDGKTIGILNMTGAIPAQIAGAEGIDFDLTKFNWLTRINKEPQVFVVNAKSKYNSWDDILKSKETIKLSATGTVGSTYFDLLVLKLVFNLQNFDIISGFSGTSDADLAILRGDVEGSASSVSSKISKIAEGNFKALLVIAPERIQELPNVPNIYDFKMSDEGKAVTDTYISMMEVARAMMTTPGVPADRVAFLRDALKKTLTNPKLLKQTAKMQRPVDYLEGEKVLDFIKISINKAPTLFVQELKKVLK
ncbi:MAG: tripartite tricarboxylate transporter substrate-binding protein [Desulfobacterales bacterium]|nr:tripartite tricarboxylate transporter substrate-binding protein [Desulfobacterales bacterium]